MRESSMKENAPDRSRSSKSAGRPVLAQRVAASSGKIEWLYAQSNAGRWGLSRDGFITALERSAEKRLSAGTLAPDKLDEYLSSLHLEDLALATACLENCEAAWEHFVGAYRGYLRSAAAAVLRCSSGSPGACELADSLFAELYGLTAPAANVLFFAIFTAAAR
jgi:hypothetical protein